MRVSMMTILGLVVPAGPTEIPAWLLGILAGLIGGSACLEA